MAYKDPQRSREYYREWNQRNRQSRMEYQREYNRNSRRANRYGISVEEMACLLANSTCDLCGKQTDKLHIDHDHTTGQVRGVLCSACNTGLGKLGDTIEGLQRAITYLERGRYDSDQAANGFS